RRSAGARALGALAGARGRDRAAVRARAARRPARAGPARPAAAARGVCRRPRRDARARQRPAPPACFDLHATTREPLVKDLHDAVAAEVGKVVVGQHETVATLLAAASLGGHVLLEGPPGVAKTLLANAVARALGVEFRRVQFTPDMLPSD